MSRRVPEILTPKLGLLILAISVVALATIACRGGGGEGEIGPSGALGPQGEQGEEGTSGSTGLQGFPGPAGPEGETGATGARGSTGAKGADGKSGILAIGPGLTTDGAIEGEFIDRSGHDGLSCKTSGRDPGSDIHPLHDLPTKRRVVSVRVWWQNQMCGLHHRISRITHPHHNAHLIISPQQKAGAIV